MKRKILKFTYVIDGIILTISYIYFFMVYLSMALLSIAYATGSFELMHIQTTFQSVVRFGVSGDESIMWFIGLFLLVILIMAIFSAVFYRKIVSKTTWLLLFFSPLQVFLQYFLSPVFSIINSAMICATGYIIYIVMLCVYAFFTIRFMCKDYKNFSTQNK